MRLCRRSRSSVVAAFVTAAGLVGAACATAEIPVIAAPATPEPTATATPPAGPETPSATPAPFDSEPGVTADSIRIGVIADIEGTEALGAERQISAWEAVSAWASTVNATGGIAGGRLVEVVLIDSQVVRHTEAVDQACQSDIFALIGSAALQDSDGLEQLEGSACSLPDFPAVANTIERLQSSVTTVSNPIAGELWNAGWARYEAATFPAAAAAAGTLLFEFPAAAVSGQRMIEVATGEGFEFVHRRQVSPQTDFETEAQRLVESGARALVWPNSGNRLIDLLRVLGDDADGFRFVDCGQACYSRRWVAEAGAVGNEVSVWLPTVPFEDAELNRELLRYLLSLPGPEAVPTVVGVQAWASALLFERALEIAIGAGTEDYDPNSLTRASVVAAARTITSWDANGLHGVANPAERIPSPCFTLLTLRGGTWQRTHPVERGVADCDPDNLVSLQFTVELGVAADTEPGATPPDDGGSLGGDQNLGGDDAIGDDPAG